MKRKLFFTICLSILIGSLLNNAIAQPNVWIKAVPDISCVPAIIQFSDSTAAGVVITSWVWDFGDGGFSIQTPPVSHSYNSPGVYSILLFTTDTSGNSDTSSTMVTVTQPVIQNQSITSVSCNGLADGNIDISVVNGFFPYSYTWSTGETTEDLNNLPAGSYSVTVTDSLGCFETDQFNITEPPALNASVDSIDHVHCNGFCTGAATVTASGGAPPYSYLWNANTGNQTAQTATGLCAGIYTVTITDSNACDTTLSITITEPPQFTIDSVVIMDISCNGGSDGVIEIISITGGSPPYNYAWSNGSNSQDLFSVSAGTFSVTIADNNGCTVAGSYTVTEPPPIIISANSVNDVSCYGSADGSIDITATGGNPPYNYVWSNLQAAEDVVNLSPGNYTVTVADLNGCVNQSAFVVSAPSPITVNIVSPDTFICTSDTITLDAGPGFNQYLWNNGAATQTIQVSYFGSTLTNYVVYVDDSNNCPGSDSILIQYDESCVWPGDANYDGIVNNYDILSIGVAYGALGPGRPNATLVWEDQPSYEWIDTFINGINQKHADCNGDGLITTDDTTAVSINYGFIHPKNSGRGCTGEPPLFIMLPDTVYAGQSYWAPVHFGTSPIPVIDLYGVAYSLDYDLAIIDSSSVSINYSNSWMGTTGSDLIGFSKDLYSMSRTDVAIVRNDRLNLPPDDGEIAMMHFTIKDDVSGSAIRTHVDISNAYAIDRDENPIPLCTLMDSMIVIQQHVGIDNQEETKVKIFPNPVRDQLFISSNNSIQTIALYDIYGRMAAIFNTAGQSNAILSLKTLASGYYIIKVETQYATVHKRLFIDQ